jgi:hypothetical protein
MGGQNNPVSRALNDLKSAAGETHPTKEQLNDLITAVRTARQTARAEFNSAQDDLRKQVTPQQEAMLIGLGYME